MGLTKDAQSNRRFWDRESDEYQRRHGKRLTEQAEAWGTVRWPERELKILGVVRGKDVLEFGCGGAQWSVALALRGARPVGLDNSAAQLRHAAENMSAAGVEFPLVHASAERVPLPDASFDVVFCDHGAMTFADPHRTVPEAARLLRRGGLFAFCMSTPVWDTCWNDAKDTVDERLRHDYFELGRWDEGDGEVVWQLPYGEWIRLFRANGLEVEDLVELRVPEGATSTYRNVRELRWGHRWPAEHIWKTRKR